MRCYTLPIGGVPEDGIHTSMVPGSETPSVVIGPEDGGVVIPMSKEWFLRMVDLQQVARQLPECKGKTLALSNIGACDLEGNSPEDYRLVARPGSDKDRRVLVRVVPQPGERVKYTGCYKVENFDEKAGKVSRGYPHLSDVVGIELIAERGGEVLLIMHQNASFRVVRPGGHKTYLLIMSKGQPWIKDITPEKGSRTRAA